MLFILYKKKTTQKKFQYIFPMSSKFHWKNSHQVDKKICIVYKNGHLCKGKEFMTLHLICIQIVIYLYTIAEYYYNLLWYDATSGDTILSVPMAQHAEWEEETIELKWRGIIFLFDIKNCRNLIWMLQKNKKKKQMYKILWRWVERKTISFTSIIIFICRS